VRNGGFDRSGRFYLMERIHAICRFAPVMFPVVEPAGESADNQHLSSAKSIERSIHYIPGIGNIVMPDAIWYFADGDEERGPVTEAQIRTLIGTGNLHAEDLVWREGLDDWMPAGEVPGLFGNGPSTAEAPFPAGRTRLERQATAADSGRQKRGLTQKGATHLAIDRTVSANILNGDKETSHGTNGTKRAV
jgi:hypothetical protein